MDRTATMTRGKRHRLFAVACGFLISGTCLALGTVPQGTAPASAPATAPAAAPAPAPAASLPAPSQASPIDSTARLLAGVPPSHADHAGLARTKAWTAHSSTLQSSWAGPRDGQLAAMKTWRNTELPKGCPVGNTLFYPFSGPDFLNAHVLFPDCDTYVLFGLEPVGVMPDVAAMKPPEFAKLLADVRRAMVNLFERNYFVTSTMRLDLKSKESLLKGVVPVLTISMVLAGAEVIAVGPSPFPRATGGKRDLDGVAIDYRMRGSPKTKRLIYYSLDASDTGLADYPDFEKYLRGLAPTTTLVKAASYLMHITEFRKIRTLLLDTSAFLLQDDTGVPFNQLSRRGWDMRVYGTYVVPIPPFEKQFQPALADLYAAGKPKPLPFRFGYFRNADGERSNLMVGRRPPGAGQPAADRR